MSDTTLRNCIICGEEGDCIESVCSNCAAEDDLAHYMSATSRLSVENKQLREEIERLKNIVKNYGSCPQRLERENVRL